MEDEDRRVPYEEDYFPPVPTAATRWARTSILWQLWRFAVINLKMIVIIFKSHK